MKRKSDSKTPGLLVAVPSVLKRSAVVCGAALFAFGAAGQEKIQPNYQPVVPGLDYAHIQTTNWSNGDPWSIHIARLNRSQKDLRIQSALAYGRIFGTAPVSAIAESFPKELGEPLVAINAGFCINKKHTYLGAPRGIGKDAPAAMVVTGGEIVSAPSKYSFWVGEDGSMHFGKFESRFCATLPDGTSLPIGLNNECNTNRAMLFTHMLGRNTRATNLFELVLELPKQKAFHWQVGESYKLRVKAVNPAGNSALSNTVAVLCFGSETASLAEKIKVGNTIRIDLKTTPDLERVVTACHAIFPIVEHGKPLEKFDAGAVIQHKNPRTAIGFNASHFFMVVVDGRQKALSMGMNAKELARFMAQLGCAEAFNLDGGGSSTFWMQGKTRNSVPGGKERARSDALVIARRVNAKSVAGIFPAKP